MPLTSAKIGETVCIKAITGKAEVCRFLGELGFIEGECVTLVSKMGGNLIIAVKDSRVALDEKMAARILF